MQALKLQFNLYTARVRFPHLFAAPRHVINSITHLHHHHHHHRVSFIITVVTTAAAAAATTTITPNTASIRRNRLLLTINNSNSSNPLIARWRIDIVNILITVYFCD
ncbi:zinc finger protein ZIC 3 [Trichinella spiralis]|uniref:zinc finger protein ZIC 3 n=1 Tax=Trichinella spiralis TaxID=6334 RepID=UPI0001EFC7A5|nr:zinc finger protein ZIC 3 [Trichinella spiralis]